MIQDPSNQNSFFKLKKFRTKRELFEYSYTLLDKVSYLKNLPIIVVPGGTSPRDFFKLLLTKNFDWTQIEMVLSDERLVNINHPKSNFRQVKRLLLDKLPPNERPQLFPELNKFRKLDNKEVLSNMNKRRKHNGHHRNTNK